MIGQTINRYKVLEKLGSGGMGDVYKAEDTKLGRHVALKFLAAHLVSDPEIRKRFEREAKAAAGLSHPNICTVFEIDEADDKPFLATEFIEGETLVSKIELGPLKLQEALDIGRQIAEGLQAAHAKGVVHRDIKPGNIMLTPDGRVKILDFGLALLTEGSKLTKLDQTVGTVAYMSPEQAQGMEVDHHTDIWALGCVLYEMATSQRPFHGHYDQALVYSILNEAHEPITGLRAGVPMELELYVGKCLEKDAGNRYSDVAEVAKDLRSLADKLKSGRSTTLRSSPLAAGLASQPGMAIQPVSGPLVRYRVIENVEDSPDSVRYLAEDTELQRSVSIRVLPQSSAQRAEREQRRKQAIAFGVGAVGVLVGLALAFTPLISPPTAPDAPLRRFAFEPPAFVNPGDANNTAMVVSPDGNHVAFVAGRERSLWVQDLDQSDPRLIEGAEEVSSPFWSPDSQYLGFSVGNEVRKVNVQGGPSSRIYELPGSHFHGPSWSHDGEVIVFGSGDDGHDLYEVPARGGEPKLLVDAQEIDPSTGEPVGATYWTHFLPPAAGDRVVLAAFRDASQDRMAVQDLATGRRSFLGPGSFPAYSPSGHIIYLPDRNVYNLWALPFSLETLQATGEPFPIAENSRFASVAADQTLVYGDAANISQGRRLVWVDRDGTRSESVGGVQEILNSPRLSPDGRFVAFAASESNLPADRNLDVWVYDIARGTRTRLSSDPETENNPVWAPTGDSVAYQSARQGKLDIFVRRADGTGEEQLLLDAANSVATTDWSADGKYILYHTLPGRDADLWYLERSEDGGEWQSHRYLEAPFGQFFARISPDGRFVAYVSDESGQPEIYVQPFPDGGRKVTVSSNGGRSARWSRDGRELFYAEGKTLVSVAVSTAGDLKVGEATRLFEYQGRAPILPPYDVSPDGRRFLIVEREEPTEVAAPKVRIVQNWYEEFRDRK